MIERMGGSAMAREAMLAALKSAGERASASAPPAGGALESAGLTTPASGSSGVDFERALADGVRQVDSTVHAADALPADLLTGRVGDFHEIAVQLKSTELSFKFALEIRNKLVDAYREVMRMQV